MMSKRRLPEFRLPEFSVTGLHVHGRWAQLQWAALGAGSITLFVLAFAAIAPPTKPLATGTSPAGMKPDAVSLARLDFGCQACDRLRLTMAAKPPEFVPRPAVSAGQLAERFATTSVTKDLPARNAAETVVQIAAVEAAATLEAPAGEAAQQSTSATGPSLVLQLKRNLKTGARTAFPFSVEPTAENRQGKVLIAQVPNGVSFTSGRRSGPGMWVLNVAEAPVTDMLVEPEAPPAFALTFMLMNREGTVVSGIDMAVTLIDVKSSKTEKAEKPDATVGKPLPKAYSLGRQSKLQPAPAPSRAHVRAPAGLRRGIELASTAKPAPPEVKRADVVAPATFATPKPFPIPQALGTTFSSMN